MSGIVGIVRTDGQPVSRDLMCSLTEGIRYRGPDAREVWTGDGVAFGHTMLRTTFEAERERQPCSLDGNCWITADCRIDGRPELIAELTSRGRADAATATDPELILHAYAVWGDQCVDHLIGDFAFAIWDATRRRLFCARDHLGFKLFYYAGTAGSLIFGNTINTLRDHPDVTDRLNDLAIADFLLIRSNLDPATTAFADIRCLPPAHTLAWSPREGGEVSIGRYWTLPVDPPLRYRKRSDYTDHFLDLLRTAVGDRMRASRVAIYLSGGLDSAGLAVAAAELAGDPRRVSLHAHTSVYDRLIPDEERFYTGLTAAHLKIPVTFHAQDDYGLFEARGGIEATASDPRMISEYGPDFVTGVPGAVARDARVALFGEGPDNALHYEWRPYVRKELQLGHWGTILSEIVSFPFRFRQLPFAGRAGRSVRASFSSLGEASFPAWLNPDFARRLSLRERYERMNAGAQTPLHPWRPVAYASFLTYAWRNLVEEHDPGNTHLPLEVRQPYMDLRMLRFLLAVPVLPWCRGKYLARQALAPKLPPAVSSRPKTGVPGFPALERWKQAGCPLMMPSENVSAYVDRDALRGTFAGENYTSVMTNLRPLALDLFLQNLRR